MPADSLLAELDTLDERLGYTAGAECVAMGVEAWGYGRVRGVGLRAVCRRQSWWRFGDVRVIGGGYGCRLRIVHGLVLLNLIFGGLGLYTHTISDVVFVSDMVCFWLDDLSDSCRCHLVVFSSEIVQG